MQSDLACPASATHGRWAQTHGTKNGKKKFVAGDNLFVAGCQQINECMENMFWFGPVINIKVLGIVLKWKKQTNIYYEDKVYCCIVMTLIAIFYKQFIFYILSWNDIRQNCTTTDGLNKNYNKNPRGKTIHIFCPFISCCSIPCVVVEKFLVELCT